MDADLARARVHQARVARLGTVTSEGRPHLVPCCFALLGDTIYSAVDAKPKTTTALRRIDNLRAHDRASLLVDRYDDDWSQLWWVRLDGRARVIQDQEELDRALVELREKYLQYQHVAIPGPVIAVEVDTWRYWP